MKYRSWNAGSSIVELIIIAALVGVFALAVFVVNPIEQIKKARDTQSKGVATELLNAINRFYLASNPPSYPWNTDAAGFTAFDSDPLDSFIFDSTKGEVNWNWINSLADTGEIKTVSQGQLRLSRQYKILHNSGADASTSVCFYPLSTTMRTAADTYCLTNGDAVNQLLPETCATTTGEPPATPGTNPICVP